MRKAPGNLIADINALRSAEGYLNAGIPNYNHLFGRDACVSALQLLNFDAGIARSTLKAMARYQAKHHGLMDEAHPGKIPHEHFPGGLRQVLSSSLRTGVRLRRAYTLLLWRFPYYGTVDAGAWFIILLHRYYKKTGDEALLRELWPTAVAVTAWLEMRATSQSTGLIAYRRRYMFGLFNQSWKDTISLRLRPPIGMVEVQGYYYEAYVCLSELAAEVIKSSEDSRRFDQKAKELQASLNRSLWRKESGYFSLALNDRGEHDTSAASNPGHLLFTDILSKEQADGVVRRIMSSDMLTPYGIRTLSSTEKVFDPASYQQGSVWPFDNWVIYQGLLKLGYVSEANVIKNGLIRAYEQLGIIPELYRVSLDNTLSTLPAACTVQAWSAGALINMTTDSEPVL